VAKAGAKRMLWVNVFDVSRAPAIETRAKALLGGLAPDHLAAVSRAVAAHDAEMDGAIARLRAAHPGLAVAKLDLFARFPPHVWRLLDEAKKPVAANAYFAQFGTSDVDDVDGI
jgi:hypothetical protein